MADEIESSWRSKQAVLQTKLSMFLDSLYEGYLSLQMQDTPTVDSTLLSDLNRSTDVCLLLMSKLDAEGAKKLAEQQERLDQIRMAVNAVS